MNTDESFTYANAGVDVSHTDSMKRDMAEYLKTDDRRVLNGLGPFASLYDIDFRKVKNPVLVLKSEEPGSKQKLAMEYGYEESICHDMINHLVNDIAVMGARPLAVLDTIVCGRADRNVILALIKGMSEACKANECTLVGGETSVQPQVVDDGIYVLTSSVAGIISRKDIIDGSAIRKGDAVLAVASNGLHTNGYTLVRMLMDKMPRIKDDMIDGESFIAQIMKPHTPYYKAIKGLFGKSFLHGMAHITGGGMEGNLCRIMLDGLSARIDLDKVVPLPLFSHIKKAGDIDEAEMLSTFNCGVGLIVVVPEGHKKRVRKHISKHYPCYEIGRVVRGDKKVVFENHVKFV